MRTYSDISNLKPTASVLSERLQVDRLAILEKMIAANGPLALTELSAPLQDAARAIAENAVFVIEDEKIVYAYPVSGHPTAHHVMLDDGRRFYAMCAIDALGAAFTFHSGATIESECAVSGEPVHVRVADGELQRYSPNDCHAIHVELEEGTDWYANC